MEDAIAKLTGKSDEEGLFAFDPLLVVSFGFLHDGIVFDDEVAELTPNGRYGDVFLG